MIQIDIPAPKSCRECPIKQGGDEYPLCPIMPGIPAWRKEVEESADHRPEHCLIKEVHEKKFKRIKVPEKCEKCSSIKEITGIVSNNWYCGLAITQSSDSCLDISTAYVNPKIRPHWCPIVKLNKDISELPSEKREALNKTIIGLSSIFGNAGAFEDEERDSYEET